MGILKVHSNHTRSRLMSEILKNAQISLQNCEVELRKLGGEALAAGLYTDAEKIAQVAKQISDFDFIDSADGLYFREASRVSKGSRENPIESVAAVEPPKRTRKTGTRKGYPFFEVEGNHLIKVSWSKTKKDEYVHKAPKEVLHALIATFVQMSSKNKIIPTEKMFPLSNAETQFPDYQSYLCLLWLKLNKLVIHHGREGYQLRDPKTFAERCDQLWQELDA